MHPRIAPEVEVNAAIALRGLQPYGKVIRATCVIQVPPEIACHEAIGITGIDGRRGGVFYPDFPIRGIGSYEEALGKSERACNP
jgi:hypothetical protein